MFPDSYKNDFEWDIAEQTGKDKLRRFAFRPITTETKCPYCSTSNIRRNGSYSKKGFKDITAEGETVVLSFKLHRYICKDCSAQKTTACGKKSHVTFSSSLPDCVPAKDKVSTHLVDAIVQKIAQDRATISQASKNFKVSQSSVSAQIEARRKKAEECFKTWMPAEKLLIYPFNYSNATVGGTDNIVDTERCAILGVTTEYGDLGPSNEYAMLYAILDDCKEETILAQLRKIPFDGDVIPDALLTDFPRPTLHKEVPEIYPEIDLAIERSFSFAKMESVRLKGLNNKALILDLLALKRIFAVHCYDPISDEFMPIGTDDMCFTLPKEEHVDRILQTYSDHNIEEIARGTFAQMYALWKDDRSEHSKELLSELCEAIEENMDSIALGLCYEKAEYDPANLLKFIDECRERKIPFKDLQSWLALISDVHNKEKITAVQMLSSTFVPQPIHRFCIDLNKLNELLGI